MKKLFPVALASLLALPLVAQEESPKSEDSQAVKAERKDESTIWPAYFALSEIPRTVDLVGLRITVPFSSAQENVTGVDIGLWGKSNYFEGIQLNVLRNRVIDSGSGIQIGCYNSVGRGDMLGLQIGLWNEAMSFRGMQVGLVNLIGEGEGFQIGLINRAETMHGYQIGLVNVIRDAELQFFPIVNVGF
ncbi:MAG: hypothetical protein K6G91_13520 [Kiritimatiellae bacterium]|nr:hypothetical protein [Kiritimatiellia bacterium]